MIAYPLILRYRKTSDTYKQGLIIIPAEVEKVIGIPDKDGTKEVDTIFVTKKDLEMSEDKLVKEIKKRVEELKNYKSMENELEKLKRDMGFEI